LSAERKHIRAFRLLTRKFKECVFSDGECTVNFSIQRVKPVAVKQIAEFGELDSIIAGLKATASRSDCRELLLHTEPTREKLYQIARRLDLPCDRRTTKSQLAEAIVEATIGFRLNSEAILRPLGRN